MDINFRAENSNSEAPPASESDKDSENATTIEDISVNEAKESLITKKIPSQSSSFVQNILYEDSCTGVTVIDLFIALKSVKENLEFLSKSNEKMSDRVYLLNEETESAWKEFVELLDSVRIFLDKMNKDALNLSWKNIENKFSNKAPTNDSPSFDVNKSKNQTKWSCAECGGEINEIHANENQKLSCLDCLFSTFKERTLSQLSVSPEKFLGSFLTSVLQWQKMRERERKPKSVKSSSSTLEEVRSDGSLNIKESTVQMICDICEILNVAGVRERDDLQSVISLESASDSYSKNPVDTYDELHWSSGMSGVSNEKCLRSRGNSLRRKNDERPTGGVENGGEMTSEGDSEFEEALTCEMNHHHDLRSKPSMTCMGDLSKAVVEKKSASTITPYNNIFSSWVGKLSDVIRSKIKQIKSKQKNKANIKVFEKPFEKSETALKKHPGMLQFSVKANTSAGVFDITVVQYKKHCYLAKTPANYKRNAHFASGSDSHDFNQNFDPPLLKDCKDEFWSDESLGYSESESMETCSNFGDDDMVEFLEIYLESKDNADFKQKGPVLSPKSPQYGECKNIALKTGKSHFFEMHKCYAVYFVEEFIKKTSKTEVDKRSESENISNDASDEEIFSLNTDEKQEKQIVIKGSSSDLVVYIQVKVDESEPNSSLVLFDFEKSPFRTKAKENDPQTSSAFFEKAIRLSENQQKGESLYNVWRAHEVNQIPETADMDIVTSEKPFVGIEKQEEKEQRIIKYDERMKEKSMSFREDFFENFDEREIQEVKMTNRADALIIREIKQSAQIWYHQIPKRWKTEILKLRPNPKLSRDMIELINSSAGELRKALCFIREIEDDIVEAQFEDAISILPRLEIELRNHLHTKIKGLEIKESKDRLSVCNFFSSFDLDQLDDSFGGRSEESSEYRFNYLLKLLSNLEDAVKANEHASNKIELSRFDSSKIYGLLHALTDSIRELEEVPNIAGLSQILDIASKLDHAIREYDNIVKKQPADYLAPQEKGKKKRKPKWNTPEEESVAQHLKKVRKKVFEVVEMEAVGMEDRIQRDFEKLDQLKMENDEAMMFLEALIKKIQKRVSEFQNIKSNLQEMYSSVNILCENYRKEAFQEKEKKIEAGKPKRNLKKSSERISGSISGRTLKRKIRHRVQERTANKVLELSTDGTSKKNSERSLEIIPVKIGEGTPAPNPERSGERIFEKNSESFSEQTQNDVLERTLYRTSEESSRETAENFMEEISRKEIDSTPDSISNKITEKMSEEISKEGSENIPEKISEKIQTSSKSSEVSSTITASGETSRKTPEKILDKIQQEEAPKSFKTESPSMAAPEVFLTSTNQEFFELISSTFIDATEYVKSKPNTNKNEFKVILPPSQPAEKTNSLKNLSTPNQLSCTIIEFKVIGQNSLYLSWTEPEGSLEGSITGYEIHVDGKLNQKVRNPKRAQAVLYSVNLSKKIQVQLYAVVENNVRVLLASMDLNGE